MRDERGWGAWRRPVRTLDFRGRGRKRTVANEVKISGPRGCARQNSAMTRYCCRSISACLSRRCRFARSDLGERWPARLVATASEDSLIAVKGRQQTLLRAHQAPLLARLQQGLCEDGAIFLPSETVQALIALATTRKDLKIDKTVSRSASLPHTLNHLSCSARRTAKTL